MPFNLKEMTIVEKFEAMELLWDDLCRNQPDFSSPAWHENVLKERERRLREGKEASLNWEATQKQLMP